MKWRVEFNGAVMVEADTEEAAIRAGLVKLYCDGPGNILFADADPELVPDVVAALMEELTYTNGIVAQYEAAEKGTNTK